MNPIAKLKNSPLGKIPVDWDIEMGEALAEKITKGASPKWQGFNYVDDGVLFVTSENVRDGFLDVSSPKFVEPAFNEKQKNSRLKQGDILINLVGASIGRSCRFETDLEYPANINQAVCLFRPNGKADAAYLKHFLQAPATVARLLGSQADGARPNVSLTDIRSFHFLIPPLPEQQKIAAILSTWDRAIELTENLIAAKQRRKQALMQQLLTGKVRLPGFGGGSKQNVKGIVRVPAAVRRGIYPPSVQPGIPKLGRVPTGWQKKMMADLLRIEKRSVTLQDDEEYQLVVAKRNRGGIEPRERLRGSEIKTPTQFEVREGDFLISRRQIIHGACGVVPASLDGAVVSNEYSVCTVNDELDLTFLKYLTHTLYFQQTCFHASVGVALEKMIFRLEKWLIFPFLIPHIDEQRAIARVLQATDHEIDLLVSRAELLRRQKTGLMQRLLTGKSRVTVPSKDRNIA